MPNNQKLQFLTSSSNTSIKPFNKQKNIVKPHLDSNKWVESPLESAISVLRLKGRENESEIELLKQCKKYK